ncbi:hypothetical protein KA478_02460 [Patescibacteria group bacterium]|nr:hypothetical protein [Patescibacteria group bacterium]
MKLANNSATQTVEESHSFGSPTAAKNIGLVRAPIIIGPSLLSSNRQWTLQTIYSPQSKPMAIKYEIDEGISWIVF